MKKWLRAISTMIAMGLILLPFQARAQEEARHFIAALEAYKSGDFETAVSNLEGIAQKGIAQKGIINGELFYNLGNAHLKNEALGKAILWYERALILLPNDPDLRFNYDYARSLTKDAPDTPAVSLWRIFFFWKFQLNARMIIYLALGGNLVFWSLLMAWRIRRRKVFRNLAIAVGLPTFIFIGTAIFNYYSEVHQQSGVVIQQQVSVRSGLENTSTELFVLHAGAKVKVIKKNRDHFQIRFSKDKIGWIDGDSLGTI